MSNLTHFKNQLKKQKQILIDGAMGTEIQRRGINTSLPLWSAPAIEENPEIIQQIHLDYIQAGAKLIKTNTFRTNFRTWQRIGKEQKAKELTIKACDIGHTAREKSKKENIILAGSIAPVEDCYETGIVPSNDELFFEHHEMVKWFREGRADLIFIETMNTIREAEIATQAAKEENFDIIVSFVCDESGNLLSGESIEEAYRTLHKYKPLAICTNCRPLDTIEKSLKKLSDISDIPLGIFANGIGHPHDDQGWIFEENNDSVSKYCKYVKKWLSLGVQIIGGCCGTTPRYIEAIDEVLKKKALKALTPA